jgi:4-hydroxy-tetrahydrodipicolinate synthase
VSRLFGGVAVALVSLFDDDGRLLIEQTAELAASLADRGVRAVAVAGTTGEPWRLTIEDRIALVRACKKALPADVPVLVGTGDPELAEAVHLTRAVLGSGADAVLPLAPPGVADCRPYYEAVAAAADGVPVIAYHFPLIAPPGIAVEHLSELPIAGVKDSSADADRLLATLAAYAGPLYVGSASYLALAGPLGAAGAILALANVEPERCAAAFAGDMEVQRELVDAHLRSLENFPRELKAMISARDGTPTAVREGTPAPKGADSEERTGHHAVRRP